MSLSPLNVVLITTVIIALSAFFVAAEFALLAAKRHRLEDRALHSRSARAALRNASELTVLLAGSQLGITVSALALGAITKPAVHDWLLPAFEGFGLPEVTADIVAFILALFVVTFLHLVVGEMAPKSWAIAHPELSATVLAIPMRGFLFVTRPVLIALNNSANWLLKRVGVDPVNSVSAAQNADSLKQLVQHSVHTGALEVEYSTRVAAALAMQSTPVKTLVPLGVPIAMVSTSATVGQVRMASENSGHHRIIVGDQMGELPRDSLNTRVVGVVHVRDTLTSSENTPIRRLIRPILRLPADQSIYESLAQMRRTSSHIAVVMEGVQVVGLVTLSDVISGLVQHDSTSAHIAVETANTTTPNP
jgi:CBS domain containing-hemolysin-like protein